MSNIIFLKNILKYKTFYLETKYFSDYKDFIDCSELSKEIKTNSNVAIYGFGPYGQSYFVKMFYTSKIVAIFDRNFEINKRFIRNPDNITSVDFDYIIITVMNERARKEVKDFFIDRRISEEKIVYVDYINQ